MSETAAGPDGGRPAPDAPPAPPGPRRHERRASAVAPFAGPGEMRARGRDHDWAATPLGPVACWPAALRTTVALVLAAPTPMVLLWGPEHHMVYNDAYAAILGIRHPAALGRPGREVWPEVWETHSAPLVDAVLRTGTPSLQPDVRLLLDRQGGPTERCFTVALGAVPDDAGQVGGVLASVFETTERVHAEAERERLLREAEAARGEADLERRRLLAVLEQLPVGVHVAEAPSGRLLVDNAAIRAICGEAPLSDGVATYSADYAGHFPPGHPRAGEALASDDWPLARALATGVAVEGELVEIRRGDGTRRLASVSAVPVRDAEGRVVGGVATSVDVSEQARAREAMARALAESERARAEAEAARARLEAVLGSIADAFYLLDREWRFTFVNDAAEPLLQTTRAALLGRTLWEAFPDVAGSPFEAPYREAMASGRVTSAEAYFPPLGTWFDVRTYPWAGGLMVHFRDVGPRKAAEAERERLLADAQAARAEAEAANRTKSEFLAVMSHELRTPLNAIGGYAELLELGIHGPVTPQQAEDLRRLQASQRHLLGLINEVLNYAKLETGTVHYDVAAVGVHEALVDAEALVAPQARAKGLALHIADCPAALAVRADAEKLRQILVNLLSNAVKFTARGGRIALECAEAGDRIRIAVRDTGIGIAADQLERIFDPFVQVRSDLTRPHEGTGLGLAISRDLARGMGGDLSATSVPGVGSAFTLTLPRAAAP